MFDSLSERLGTTLQGLRGKGRLSDADIDATAREIRIALLEADVALPVVRGFISRIKERAKGAEVSGALNPAQQVVKIVNEELVAILGGETRRLNLAKEPPTVIMLAGLQGSGKTTLAGKLGRWLRAQGHTPLLVACDLQRPNAVNQLQIVGQRADVATYAPHPGATGSGELPEGPGDPVAVARDGVAYAREKHHDVVVVDTAGRLGVDEELMRQASDIRAAVQPDEVLFVVDAMIGQDAVATAEAFRDGVGFTGVVLTKLDGDARGGAALSVREVTGEPILFASNGEKLTDFDVFHPDRMSSRILGMGDLLTLIEQAEQVFDAEQSQAAAQKMSSGELTLDDFLQQMLQLRKMGPIGNILNMLPGANSGQMKAALEQVDEKQIDKLQAIIRGMTRAERDDPKIINASRRQRIANGSGVTVGDVNDLVDRFFEMRKMMKQMAGQFGMGGPGGGRKATKKVPKNPRKAKQAKKNRRSGNPANRAAQGQGGPDLSHLPPSLQQLPPGLGGGMDQLPPGFDPSKLDFGKKK
ncbi:signal recognition particle protein [Pseudonocardia phyllosphaerae]|uniref:signal recognition particle protein n=1 Tax=Pseudonocardia phyllosphaerae TaxID=3390502 RepID=UPI00397974C7